MHLEKSSLPIAKDEVFYRNKMKNTSGGLGHRRCFGLPLNFVFNLVFGFCAAGPDKFQNRNNCDHNCCTVCQRFNHFWFPSNEPVIDPQLARWMLVLVFCWRVCGSGSWHFAMVSNSPVRWLFGSGSYWFAVLVSGGFLRIQSQSSLLRQATCPERSVPLLSGWETLGQEVPAQNRLNSIGTCVCVLNPFSPLKF